jgi:hypothetical protein
MKSEIGDWLLCGFGYSDGKYYPSKSQEPLHLFPIQIIDKEIPRYGQTPIIGVSHSEFGFWQLQKDHGKGIYRFVCIEMDIKIHQVIKRKVFNYDAYLNLCRELSIPPSKDFGTDGEGKYV